LGKYVLFTWISPNPLLKAKLNKIGLDQVGNIFWSEHIGVFTNPVRAAVQYWARIYPLARGEFAQDS
jgi:hypothetical protein